MYQGYAGLTRPHLLSPYLGYKVSTYELGRRQKYLGLSKYTYSVTQHLSINNLLPGTCTNTKFLSQYCSIDNYIIFSHLNIFLNIKKHIFIYRINKRERKTSRISLHMIACMCIYAYVNIYVYICFCNIKIIGKYCL